MVKVYNLIKLEDTTIWQISDTEKDRLVLREVQVNKDNLKYFEKSITLPVLTWNYYKINNY